MGRPRLTRAIKKGDVIRFRCRPDQSKAIREAAKQEGMSLSEYILFVLMRAREKQAGS
jgi:uncharacterized protein (DUF1778 family)